MNNSPIDVEGLATALQREFEAADSYFHQVEELQSQAFRYYEGQPFGNEVEGRSQIVLPDVQETIDYMTESLMRTVDSADHVVEFEAVEEEYEQASQDATEAINFWFKKRQDGYRILHDAGVDGLLRKYGVFKTCVEQVERVKRETLTGDPLHIGMLPDHAEIEDLKDNEDGTVTIRVKYETKEKVYRDYAVPPAEFRFSPNARHEDEADYLAHVCEKTRSDLVEMGFDREQVYALPAYTRANIVNRVESALDNMVQHTEIAALEKVLLCEEYARIDLDDDGIAERVKVYRVDTEILRDAETQEPSIETVEEQPFAVWSPYLRPHKLVGYSVADKVMDLQLARSYVARQLFDGMALANMPRPIVDANMADADTYADILAPIPGSPIRVKGGVASVQPFQSGFDVGKSLSVMEWQTGERESRTGITRLNQGLDADTLNKTATGTALLQSSGQQQEEFVARHLGQGISRLFAKKYRLMKAEGIPLKIKVDGTYKVVDPSQWPDDFCLTVRIVGTGSKDRRIQYRMAVIPIMAEGMMQGQVTPQNAFKMMDGLFRDMGLGKGDDYWVDPDTPEGQQQLASQSNKPDPKLQAAQMKAQADQQKLQVQAQSSQQSIALQGQVAAAKIQQAREAAQQKIDAQREADALKAMQEQDRLQAEAMLEMRRQDIEADTKRHVAETKPGGRLDA